MTSREQEIENQAERDLILTGQTTPPFRPSVILRHFHGVRTEIGNVKDGTAQAVMISGRDPHVRVSRIIGTALARFLVGHEAGHARRTHVVPTALFDIPVGSRGTTLSKDKEREADQYARAVTMPRRFLEEALEDGPESLATLTRLFDVPEAELRRRLQTLELWRLVYDDRNHVAYIRSGWWTLTRRPKYLAGLAESQGRSGRQAQCETSHCNRLASRVHHLRYDYGHETDEDLEALCDQCHYDSHITRA